MQWEFDFLYLLQEMHNPVLDKIMVAFTTLGDAGIIWIVLAVVLLFSKKYRKCGINMALALVVMLILGNVILKNIFMRDRPCWLDESIKLLIENPHDYSFPSGHTFSSIAAASVILMRHRTEGIIAMFIALLIAFSRMYLFVHFPTDILASLLLGVVTAVVTYMLTNKYYDKLAVKLIERKSR